MARPDILQTTRGPPAASPSMPDCQSAYSSSEFARGHPGARPRSGRRRRRGPPQTRPVDRDGSSARRPGSAPPAPEDLGSWQGQVQPAHRADATEAGSGHLVIDEPKRLRDAVSRRKASDDGVGATGGLGVVIECNGLVNRVTAGGRGDVDEFRRSTGRTRSGRGSMSNLRCILEGLPSPSPPSGGWDRYGYQSVRAGVPEVHVRIDDAVGGAVIGPPSRAWSRRQARRLAGRHRATGGRRGHRR